MHLFHSVLPGRKLSGRRGITSKISPTGTGISEAGRIGGKRLAQQAGLVHGHRDGTKGLNISCQLQALGTHWIEIGTSPVKGSGTFRSADLGKRHTDSVHLISAVICIFHCVQSHVVFFSCRMFQLLCLGRSLTCQLHFFQQPTCVNGRWTDTS